MRIRGRNPKVASLVPRDERGAALIIAIIVLGSLSLMALAALLSSGTEMKIARNQRLHARAFWAAEAGIQWAITQINQHPDRTDPDYMGAPQTAGGLYDLTVPDAGPWADALPDGSSYSVTVGWKRDLKDQDHAKDAADALGNPQANPSTAGSGAGEIVYYNPWYGYADSPATATQQNVGYPIQVITSVGRSGTSMVEVRLEIGKAPFDVHVKGALSANSNVETTGNIEIDGRDHDINGNNTNTGCGSGANLPAVSTTEDYSVDKQGSSDLQSDNPDKWTNDDTAATYPSNPEEALGLVFDARTKIAEADALGLTPAQAAAHVIGDSPLKDYAVSTASAPDTINGIVWVTGDYARPGGSPNQGILIVHNPLFDPRAWDASVFNPAAPTHYQTGSSYYQPKLDPTNPAYDLAYVSAHAPANLGNWNANNVFKGVIIADKIDKINGNVEIIGAVISLSTIDVDKIGNGSAIISYSCEAISKIAVTGYTLKLSWSRE
jgi:Tfp pilus assembly protein PilX